MRDPYGEVAAAVLPAGAGGERAVVRAVHCEDGGHAGGGDARGREADEGEEGGEGAGGGVCGEAGCERDDARAGSCVFERGEGDGDFQMRCLMKETGLTTNHVSPAPNHSATVRTLVRTTAQHHRTHSLLIWDERQAHHEEEHDKEADREHDPKDPAVSEDSDHGDCNEEDEKDEREADCERSNTWLQKNPLRGGHNGLHLRVTIGTRNEGGATHEPDEKTVPRF